MCISVKFPGDADGASLGVYVEDYYPMPFWDLFVLKQLPQSFVCGLHGCWLLVILEPYIYL